MNTDSKQKEAKGPIFIVQEIPDLNASLKVGDRMTVQEVAEFLELCAAEVRARSAFAACMSHGQYLFAIDHEP